MNYLDQKLSPNMNRDVKSEVLRQKRGIKWGAVAGFIFIIALASDGVWARPYYRFWRGWKIPQRSGQAYSYEQFAQDINQVFIPRTVAYGSHGALISYLPVLPATPAETSALRTQGIDLPDEVALVVYDTLENYTSLRNTEEGRSYADLHRVYFDMDAVSERSKSRSAVPEEYVGAVALSHAYDLLASSANWREAPLRRETTRFVLRVKKPETSDAEYLREVTFHFNQLRENAESLGLVSVVAFVDPKYWMEYQTWERPTRFEDPSHQMSRLPVNLGRSLDSVVLQTISLNLPPYQAGHSEIHYGDGGNVQW